MEISKFLKDNNFTLENHEALQFLYEILITRSPDCSFATFR